MLFTFVMNQVFPSGLVDVPGNWDGTFRTRNAGATPGAPLGDGGTLHAGHGSWRTIVRPVAITDTMGIAKPSSYVMQSLVSKPLPVLPYNGRYRGYVRRRRYYPREDDDDDEKDPEKDDDKKDDDKKDDDKKDDDKKDDDKKDDKDNLSDTEMPDEEAVNEIKLSNLNSGRTDSASLNIDSALNVSVSDLEKQRAHQNRLAEEYKRASEMLKSKSIVSSIIAGQKAAEHEELVKEMDIHIAEAKRLASRHHEEQVALHSSETPSLGTNEDTLPTLQTSHLADRLKNEAISASNTTNTLISELKDNNFSATSSEKYRSKLAKLLSETSATKSESRQSLDLTENVIRRNIVINELAEHIENTEDVSTRLNLLLNTAGALSTVPQYSKASKSLLDTYNNSESDNMQVGLDSDINVLKTLQVGVLILLDKVENDLLLKAQAAPVPGADFVPPSFANADHSPGDGVVARRKLNDSYFSRPAKRVRVGL